MKTSERRLRAVIRGIINEFGMRPIRTMPSGDDRRFAVSALPTSSIGGGDVSQTDAVKLMSASTGFFQTLVDAIRFGFLTREEVSRICSSLEKGCEDNFKSLVISHPCLKWWKNDVSKLAMKIGDDTDFKRDFCESVKSNCEMVRSNYNKALGNIKKINMGSKSK